MSTCRKFFFANHKLSSKQVFIGSHDLQSLNNTLGHILITISYLSLIYCLWLVSIFCELESALSFEENASNKETQFNFSKVANANILLSGASN